MKDFTEMIRNFTVMKRINGIKIMLAALLLCTSCSKKAETVSLTSRVINQKTDVEKINQQNQTAAANQNGNQVVNSVIPTQVEYLEMPDVPDEYDLDAENLNLDISKVDVDLSVMSATMIYSEVFNMVIMPEEYEEKTLKIKGNFAVYIGKETGKRYYSVIIPDATKCCQQGIEFVWAGNHSYPEDFPEIGEEITATGIYKTTETKDGLTYNYMQVQTLEKVN